MILHHKKSGLLSLSPYNRTGVPSLLLVPPPNQARLKRSPVCTPNSKGCNGVFSHECTPNFCIANKRYQNRLFTERAWKTKQNQQQRTPRTLPEFYIINIFFKCSNALCWYLLRGSITFAVCALRHYCTKWVCLQEGDHKGSIFYGNRKYLLHVLWKCKLSFYNEG